MAETKVIKEGALKKGGVNKPPTTQRPPPPKPQNVKRSDPPVDYPEMG